MAAVFVDFLRTNVIFLHKNTLDILRRVQFLTPYEEFFSWCSRHHCRMEIGAYAKLHYNVCLWPCMCCSFRRDIDVTRSKFLSKNKCNYLQHHSVHNYKFSNSNKNKKECRGKLQSNNQVIASQDWVTLNLGENLVFSVSWRCRHLAGTATAGKKHPGSPLPTY